MKNLTYLMIVAFLLSMTLYSCASSDDSTATATSTTSTYTVKGSM
jgi:hypothetical protein